MTRLDPQVKAVLVARLRERRAAGELTSAQVRRAAAGVGSGRVGSGRRAHAMGMAYREPRGARLGIDPTLLLNRLHGLGREPTPVGGPFGNTRVREVSAPVWSAVLGGGPTGRDE